MDLREVRRRRIDRINLAHHRNRWGGGGSCKWGNEPSGSKKIREISSLAGKRLASEEGLSSS